MKQVQFDNEKNAFIQKSLIVIDGMNVALRKNQKSFSSFALKQAADFFIDRGHAVHIFLPDYIIKPGKNKKVHT